MKSRDGLTRTFVSVLRAFTEFGSSEWVGTVLFFTVVFFVWKKWWPSLVTLIVAVPGGMLLNELLKQLTVVKPTNPLVFSIPGVSNLMGLALTDSFIDYRRKRIGDKEYFDTVHFFVKWESGNTVTVNCDDAVSAQRAREALWASKVKFAEEEKKSPKGILVGAKYTFPAAIFPSSHIVRASLYAWWSNNGISRVLSRRRFGAYLPPISNM